MFIVTMAYEFEVSIYGEELLKTTDNGHGAMDFVDHHQKYKLKDFIKEEYPDDFQIDINNYRYKEVANDEHLLYRETIYFSVHKNDNEEGKAGSVMYSIWRS